MTTPDPPPPLLAAGMLVELELEPIWYIPSKDASEQTVQTEWYHAKKTLLWGTMGDVVLLLAIERGVEGSYLRVLHPDYGPLVCSLASDALAYVKEVPTPQ